MEYSSLTADDFWGFSLRLYRDALVQSTCLKGQDDHGADVNLLLLGIWLETRNIRITKETYLTLKSLSDRWQTERLTPLRKKRRAATKGSEAYKAFLAEELQQEKQEQRALVTALPSSPDGELSLLRGYSQQQNLPEAIPDCLLKAAQQLSRV